MATAVDRILRLREVLKRMGCSDRTLKRRIAAGMFPKPRREVKNGRPGWLESEVAAAVANYGASLDADEKTPDQSMETR